MIEERFGGDADHAAGRKFVAANPVGLMDFVGAELLLIGDKHGAVEVLEEGGGGDEEVAKGGYSLTRCDGFDVVQLYLTFSRWRSELVFQRWIERPRWMRRRCRRRTC